MRNLRVLDRPRVEERRHQRELVVLAPERRPRAVLPVVPDRADHLDVLAQPRPRRRVPRRPVATDVVALHLRPQPEQEAPVRELLQVPRQLRRHHRAARERDRHRRAERRASMCARRPAAAAGTDRARSPASEHRRTPAAPRARRPPPSASCPGSLSFRLSSLAPWLIRYRRGKRSRHSHFETGAGGHRRSAGFSARARRHARKNAALLSAAGACHPVASAADVPSFLHPRDVRAVREGADKR